MKICTLQKSLLCEMKICTLQNIWQLVLYEMLISTFLKSFCEEASANLLFSYNHHRDTCFLSQPRRTSSWPWLKVFLTCLENADLENSDCRPKELRPSGCLENSNPKKKTILTAFATNCLKTSCLHLVDHFTMYKFHFANCFVMQVTFYQMQ